jgi:hypothetical protein
MQKSVFLELCWGGLAAVALASVAAPAQAQDISTRSNLDKCLAIGYVNTQCAAILRTNPQAAFGGYYGTLSAPFSKVCHQKTNYVPIGDAQEILRIMGELMPQTKGCTVKIVDPLAP